MLLARACPYLCHLIPPQSGLGYGALLHGEAVSIGTHMAARMSAKMGWIDESLVERTVNLLKKMNLPTELPKGGGMTMDKFLTSMGLDKKVADGKWRLILLKGPVGGCVFTGEFDEQAMRETIEVRMMMSWAPTLLFLTCNSVAFQLRSLWRGNSLQAGSGTPPAQMHKLREEQFGDHAHNLHAARSLPNTVIYITPFLSRCTPKV